MPMSAPSPLTYIMPAKNDINTPATKKASAKIWTFTAILSVKKPLDQITRNAINASMPMQAAYFINVTLVSCFTVI